MAKHAEAGDSIQVLALSYRDELLEGFHKAVEALGCLGASKLPQGGMKASFAVTNTAWGGPRLEDQRFDTRPFSEISDTISGWYYKPDIVYTHNPDDLNQDHVITARAVLTAFRAPHSQADILAFETLSSTEFGPTAFQPNHWETLTEEQLEKKQKALECYRSERRIAPHPRNELGVETQARFRGLQVCQFFAEAFQILRSIR